MISPSPTQQPPSESAPERVQPGSTPLRARPGETPAARFIKALLRAIFKVFYFIISGIRTHKLLPLLAILLLVGSISATIKVTTAQFPFGIGSHPFNFQTSGGTTPP